MSDHCPIKLNVQFNNAAWRDPSKSSVKINNSNVLNNSRSIIKYKLRWDHSDCRLFYDYTMAHSQPLLNQCSQLLSDIMQFVSMYNYDDYCRLEGIIETRDVFCSRANELYENLVSILIKSSDVCVKKFKTEYFKFIVGSKRGFIKE